MARVRRRSWLALVTVAAVGFLVASLVTTSVAASPRRPGGRLGSETNVGKQETVPLTLVQTTNAEAQTVKPFSAPTNNPATELAPEGHELERVLVSTKSTVPVPTPGSTPVTTNINAFGWEGLDHLDQRLAGGGNQFSLEPPDQGLCVGNVSPNGPADGVEVVEAVNDAIGFFDSTTHQFGVPLTLSEFFGLPPTIDRSTGTFGPSVGDPKCYFDTATQRWFVTMLAISQDPVTGDLVPPATTFIAVSTSSEALGTYFVYALDATDSDHAGCPCFGDQPLIGADQYGFYVSTAEYSLGCITGGDCVFNGPQLYAIDKARLEKGKALNAVHFSGLTHIQGGRTSGTVQPSATPNGVFETAAGGAEYFLSGYDCVPDVCNIAAGNFDEITAWALTNTSSLDTKTPTLTLSLTDLQSEGYGTPVGQPQPSAGPRPLGDEVGETPNLVEANDSRMNQVTFAQGLLWGAINTLVNPGHRDGIAWFAVRPSIAAGAVSAVIQRQAYVAGDNVYLSFPSIGIGDTGNGVLIFTLMGRQNYPSAAQIRIGQKGTSGSIEIVQPGFRPYDGFGCYPSFGLAKCRWGDYSASVAAPDGTIYSATEMVGDNARTFFENWSTFIWPTTP